MTNLEKDDWFFHYTTASGLKGILDDKVIWATDANYLNDFREVQLGIGYARAWLKRNSAALSNEFGESVVDTIKEILQPQPRLQFGLRMFVCSFSEDCDSLSQWRAYGGNGGYAIGIHRNHLVIKAKQLGLDFRPCEYEHDESDNPVAEFLDGELRNGIFARLRAKTVSIDGAGSWLAPLCNGVMRNSVILKGKAFEEEREWRLFPGPSFGSEGDFHEEFRVRSGVFVPFVKFPIFPADIKEQAIRKSDGSCTAVLRLMIGPTRFKELAMYGLCRMKWDLQGKFQFRSPEHSSASYRDW